MKLNLNPLQEMYKEASEIMDAYENSMLDYMERLHQRIFTIIGDISNYESSKTNQANIDKSVTVIRTLYDLYDWSDCGAIILNNMLSDLIHFFYLEDWPMVTNSQNLKPEHTRLFEFKDVDSFSYLKGNAKDEIIALIKIGDSIHDSVIGGSVSTFLGLETYDELPERNNMEDSKWHIDKKGIRDIEWIPLQDAA